MQGGDITADVSSSRVNLNSFFREIAQHDMVAKAFNLNNIPKEVIILSH